MTENCTLHTTLEGGELNAWGEASGYSAIQSHNLKQQLTNYMYFLLCNFRKQNTGSLHKA